MKRWAKDILLAAAVLVGGLVAVGCVEVPTPTPAAQPALHRNTLLGEVTPCGLVWSGDTIFEQMAWQAEAESRFGKGKCFLFFSHGGDNERDGRCDIAPF